MPANHEEQAEQIKVSVGHLANRCLMNAQTYHGYSEKNLLDANLIFSHFLMDFIWSENQHLSMKKRKELVKNTGGAIRALILSCCGMDLYVLAKK